MASNSRLLTCGENLCVWDLSRLLTCGDNLSVDGTSNGALVHKFVHSTAKSFTTLTWDTADQFVCVPAEEKKLMIFEFDDDDITFKEHDVGVTVSAISCNHKSSSIAVGSVTGEVLCWRKKQEKIVKTIAEMPSGVSSLQYNVSDSHIAVGCTNGTVNVFNTTSGFSGSPLKLDDTLAVRNLHFHQLNKFLLGSCYDGGQVLLWNINKSCLYQTMPEKHKAPAMDLRFSPLGNGILASVGLDKRILLHDVRLKSNVQNILCKVPLRTLDFFADGVSVVVGGSKGMACIYDLRKSAEPKCFQAHAKQVEKVAISGPRSNTIKKKREVKPRNVLSPTTNQDPNIKKDHQSSAPTSPDLDNFYTTIQEQVTKDVSDIRKLVLKKTLEHSTTTSDQELTRVQTPPAIKIPNAEFEIEESLFSPLRTDFISDNKENLHLQVAEEQICMETDENTQPEVNSLPEVSKVITEESQPPKVVQDSLLQFNTEAFRSLHMDVMNMHFQMVKQFTSQQIQIQELQETCRVNGSLVEEVQFLREENRRLKTLLDSLKNKC